MIEHGLYYIDPAAHILVRLDDDSPINLPGARLFVLRNLLERAGEVVARDPTYWGRINNLAQAEFNPRTDQIRVGVYYVESHRSPLTDADTITLLSGDLFPWKAQGPEKPIVMGLLAYVAGKLDGHRG